MRHPECAKEVEHLHGRALTLTISDVREHEGHLVPEEQESGALCIVLADQIFDRLGENILPSPFLLLGQLEESADLRPAEDLEQLLRASSDPFFRGEELVNLSIDRQGEFRGGVVALEILEHRHPAGRGRFLHSLHDGGLADAPLRRHDDALLRDRFPEGLNQMVATHHRLGVDLPARVGFHAI